MCDLATLDPATPADAPELSDLLELYQFELRTTFGLARGPDGRFGYARLPRYWSEPDTHFPFPGRRRARACARRVHRRHRRGPHAGIPGVLVRDDRALLDSKP